MVPLQPSAAAEAAADASQPGRLLIWAVGHSSSGVFDSWAAGQRRPGVALADLSPAGVARIAELVAQHKRQRDIALVSGRWVGVVGECHRMLSAVAVWHAHLHTILCRRYCSTHPTCPHIAHLQCTGAATGATTCPRSTAALRTR